MQPPDYGGSGPVTAPQPTIPSRPPRKHHYGRTALIGAGVLVVAAVSAGVASAAAGDKTPAPVVTPTVTVTQTVAGPTPTVTHTTNVKVTRTAYVPPAPQPVARYSGTGNWNSDQFALSGNPVTVKFSYWNNTSGYGGDNFIADITNSDLDDLSIANEIATAGGKTTTLYPSSDGLYHLEVQATGSWTVTITQQAD